MIPAMDGAEPVLAAVREMLEKEGAISFEELMRLALYHPQGGLYRVSCPSKGPTGHFSTCARLDPALGTAIARWLEQGWREALGSPPRWFVIEVGGGDGALAEAVLRELPHELQRRLTYLMVEQGEAPRAKQRERLGRSVEWLPSMRQALVHCDGCAMVFSNELVDAFPAVALERREGRWREIHLVRRGRLLVEQLATHPDWEPGQAHYSINELEGVPEGARAEAHRSYWQWLRDWADDWRHGDMLTIDYGSRCRDLYGRGGGGTLRAYFSHFSFHEREDLYHRIGLQDLTCDVNFTDLERWGELLGWSNEELMTQRAFLERFVGLEHEAENPALSFIARDGGAGTHFQVLWQKAGSPSPSR